MKKKTVLYFDTDNKMREYISMFIEAEWECNIINSSEVENFEATYKNLESEIDLVIADAPINENKEPNISWLNNLYKYHKENFNNIPFILFSNLKPSNFELLKNFTNDHEMNSYQEKPAEDQEFMYTVGKALGLATPEHAPDYKSINSKRFQSYNTVPCDVFIKLGRDKYVKIINKYAMYGHEVLEKYEKKEIKHFYIYSKDYPKLSKVFIKNILSDLGSDLPISKALNAQLEGHEEIYNRMQNFGFEIDDTTNTILKSTVSSTVNTLKKTLVKGIKLFQLINAIKDKSSYAFEHSLMCSYIACMISHRMGWSTGTTLSHLCIASILHDITLDNQEEALNENINMENSDLSLTIKNNIVGHPEKCSTRLTKFENFPVEIGMIISHHHELPDGSGYPNKLTADQIPPLACIFILAHEVSHRVIIDKMSKADIVIDLQNKFNVGNFRKPFSGLLKVVSGN